MIATPPWPPLASGSRRRSTIDVDAPARFHETYQERSSARMLPLYAARIEDLGRGDFVKVDCACHHVALLSPEFLLRLGLSPAAKVLDLKEQVRCRGVERKDEL